MPRRETCICQCCGEPGTFRVPKQRSLRKRLYQALELTRKTITRLESLIDTGHEFRIAKQHFPSDEAEGRRKGTARIPSFRFNTASQSFVATNPRASDFANTPTTPHMTPAFNALTEVAAESGSPFVRATEAMRREIFELRRQLWAQESELDVLRRENADLKLLPAWTVRSSTYASPGIRWERIKKGPASLIKTLIGVQTAEIFEALHDWLEVDRTLSDMTLLDASAIRACVSARVKATAVPLGDAAAALQLASSTDTSSILDSGLHLDGKGAAGRPRSLDTRNMLFLMLYALRTDPVNDEVLGWEFGLDPSTVSCAFFSSIVAVDRWSHQHHPKLSYDQALALTPPGVLQRFGAPRPTYVVDAKEQRIPVPLDPFTRAACFSNYKGADTGKMNIFAHAAGISLDVSDARPGRIGDDDLAEAAAFMAKIPRSSRILSDKGYQVLYQLAAPYDHEIIAPHRRKHGQVQLEPEQVTYSSDVARPRTVIERLIGDTVDRWPHVERQTVGRLDLMSSMFRVAFFLTRLLYPPLVDATHGGLPESAMSNKSNKRKRTSENVTEVSSDSDDPASFFIPDYDVEHAP